MKIVFVSGGVCSSLGKGIVASSIGSVLSENNNVIIRKMDPYLNIDPGTMSPLEHGEVFVTRDGGEADLDLGHYERLAKVVTTKSESVTSGKIYWEVLQKERSGKYLGKTIQVVPHITDAIKEKMLFAENKKNNTVIICELGGTVGDIESGPFLEAARQIRQEYGHGNTMFVHVGWVPEIPNSGELKTKPIQASIQTLMSKGIIPDLLFCRCKEALSEEIKTKISMFCNVPFGHIIDAIDVDDIYKLPYMYSLEGLCGVLKKQLNLKTSTKRAKKMYDIVDGKKDFKKTIKLALVGKYCKNSDSYRSLMDAIYHASVNLSTIVDVDFIDSRSNIKKNIKSYDACIVPGGFGKDGIDLKLDAIKQCREGKIPFLGICYGMQLSVIEFARNVLGIKNASSQEFGKKGDTMIVKLATKWYSKMGIELRTSSDNVGGTMRLGLYESVAKEGTIVRKLYNKSIIEERHRHRYEVDPSFIEKFEKKGLKFSAFSKNGNLPECVEIDNKDQFFVGCQFHPEFETDISQPNPLFVGVLKAALKRQNLKK